MRIASILHHKGRDVYTIGPDATAFEASRELTRHDIGCLLVRDGEQPVAGIISERDIARALADHGERVAQMPVSELMTRDIRTCTSNDTVDLLMAVMTEYRIRHLPVVDDGEMVGVVSIGDVVKHRLRELQVENDTLHGYIELGR